MLPDGSVANNPPANVGDTGLIPGSESSREGNGNLLQFSCLGNLMDREVWWATVPGIAKESGLTKQQQQKENFTLYLADFLRLSSLGTWPGLSVNSKGLL